jgi:autoinducer 2-degrading protein
MPRDVDNRTRRGGNHARCASLKKRNSLSLFFMAQYNHAIIKTHPWDASAKPKAAAFLQAKEARAMHIVHVYVRVKQEHIEDFKIATLENASNSIQEPGIARFDVLQQQDDPSRFVLVEAYRTKGDPAHHKQTRHYAKWRETVAPMMAEERTSTAFNNIFPDNQGWD